MNKYCKHCKNKNNKNTQICVRCKRDLEEEFNKTKTDLPKKIVKSSRFRISIVILISVVTVVMLLFAFYSIYKHVKDVANDPESSEEYIQESSEVSSEPESMQSSEEQVSSVPPVYSEPEPIVNLEEWTAINPEIKGYIKIPGTNINFPVLQSSIEDQHKYLYKDIYENYRRAGSIFFDAFGDISKSRTKIIYGHSQNDGSMFSYVIHYKYLEYYQAHPIIYLDTIYETGVWKIFALFRTNTNENHGKVFNYHWGSNFDDSNVPEYEDFINNILIRSDLITTVDIVASDKIILLSTCSYDFDDFRSVLVARKVRPGESEEVDVENAYLNPKALYPDIWYRYRGGTAPEWPSWAASGAQ